MAANKKKTKKSVKAKAKKSAPVKKALKAKAASKPKKTAVAKKKAAPVAKVIAAPKVSLADMKKILTPLADRILVHVQRPEEKTAGGLIIPGMAAQKPNEGQVLALGPGRRGKRGQVRPLDVRVGDKVLFPEFVGTTVTLNGAELLILREEDILGIVQ